MKYNFITLSFLLLSLYPNAQIKSELSDTSIILGMPLRMYDLKFDYQYRCDLISSKEVKVPKTVAITGVYHCDNTRGGKNHFYEVFHNNNFYYVDTSEIILTYSDLYKFILSLSAEGKKTFRENGKKNSELLDMVLVEDMLQYINTKTQGLCVLKHNVYDESEHTKGTGFEVSYYNSSKKAIKYIWITITGLNAVKDRVVDKVRGTSSITLQSIGPIKPGDTGSYEFEYVWHTDIVEYVKILSLKVQYMDNTTKIISNVAPSILPEKYKSLISVTFQ